MLPWWTERYAWRGPARTPENLKTSRYFSLLSDAWYEGCKGKGQVAHAQMTQRALLRCNTQPSRESDHAGEGTAESGRESRGLLSWVGGSRSRPWPLLLQPAGTAGSRWRGKRPRVTRCALCIRHSQGVERQARHVSYHPIPGDWVALKSGDMRALRNTAPLHLEW